MLNISDKLLNKIITTAYGDGSVTDKLYIFYKVIIDKEIRKIFFEYRKTKRTISTMKHFEMDPSFESKLNEKITKSKENHVPIFAELYLLFIEKPYVPSTAILLITAAIVGNLLFKSPVQQITNKKQYTKAELTEANEQAKYALALVGEVLVETKKEVASEIMIKQVAQPINEGMTIINDLLN